MGRYGLTSAMQHTAATSPMAAVLVNGVATYGLLKLHSCEYPLLNPV